MSLVQDRALIAAVFLAADRICEALHYATMKPDSDYRDYTEMSMSEAVAKVARLEKTVVNYLEPRL